MRAGLGLGFASAAGRQSGETGTEREHGARFRHTGDVHGVLAAGRAVVFDGFEGAKHAGVGLAGGEVDPDAARLGALTVIAIAMRLVSGLAALNAPL